MQLQPLDEKKRAGERRHKLGIALASNAREVEEAQRLRYRVFGEEMGARLDAARCIDRDAFDAFCEHLLVRDLDSAEVVGTYRMLPPDAARAAGSYYSEQEFDISRIAHLRDGLAAQAVEALGAFAAAGLDARPRTAPPSPYSMKFGVLHYQHHIHRDWAWGDSELAQARRQMELVWPRGRKLGRALFLGVGAARCAAELSHAWHADLAVGIDINPLPLLVAPTLLAGREFKFHEVPASPRSAHEPTVAYLASQQRPARSSCH
jgi:hypothetical protein